MRAEPSTLERGSGTRLAAFAMLSALAAWRYAGVETRPPTIRVVAVTAVAVATALALSLVRAPAAAPRGARLTAPGARAIALLALLVVALLAVGVPAHLLRPGRWGALASDLHGGLQTVATTLWPYAGTDSWTRVDILLPLAALPIAAAVGFWPPQRGGRAATLRYGVRQVGALALLLAVYVLGVIDSSGGSATAEGLLLLALVVAWLWLPGLHRRRVAATLAWLAATGAVAAAVAAQIGGGKAWLNYRAWDVLGPSRTGIAFSWDQTYGPITWSRSQQTMFTVSAPRPQLWKTTMLDRFDGLRFVRSGTDVPNDQDLPLPLNDRWYTFATFTIRGLSSQLLPTEQGTTVGVNIDGVIRHDTDGTTRKMGVALRNGGTYTVLSYVPRPTTSELRAAPRAFPAAYLRYTDFDLPAPNQSGLRLDATGPLRPGLFFTNRTVGTAVPGSSPAAVPDIQRRILASPYGPMYRLARRLALGMHSTYDVATAIEHYLLANYAYGEQPPVRRYPLESFLFVDRVGYCQQFSAAMALMLRMDGIPARVAAGFLPGARTGANGTFDVRAVDAHSWVEVFFTGIGWVPFNPTPPRSLGYVPKFPGYTSERTVYPYAALAATVGGLPQFAREPLPVVRRGGRTGSPGVSRIASIAAILVAVLGTLGLVVRWSSGHARLRRSLAGDGELASVEVARALRRLGYAIPATVTLSQIERLVRLHGGADAARYVQLLRERRYSAGAASAATLRQRRRLRRGLTAHLGLDARLRGLWALPPATIGWRV